MKASKKIKEVKEELGQDPLFCNFDNTKIDSKDILSQKIKEEPGLSGQDEAIFIDEERAVNDSNEIMAQSVSLKNEFGKLLMKEEIKEEYLEDKHPLSDENERIFNSPYGNSLSNSSIESSQPNFFQEKEFGKLLMKEEIKEEYLEDKHPLSDENERIFNSPYGNSLSNSSTESSQPNFFQEKVQCSPSYVFQVGLSQSNSGTPLCNRVRKCEKSQATEKNFKCNSCAYQTMRIWDLRRHERTHSGDKPFKCNSCSYQAVHMSYLQKHAKTHRDEKIFKCSYCSYKATQRRYLEEHIRKHTGEKPFKCKSCPYQAAQMGSLQKHERTHTGIKPFTCNYCPYQTAYGGNLQRHERCHMGEKPFKCSFCPYQSVNMKFLRKHKKTDMNEKIFECNSCVSSGTNL